MKFQQEDRKFGIDEERSQKMMVETCQLSYCFIRKFYLLIVIQLLTIMIIASTLVHYFHNEILHFFTSTGGGVASFTILGVTPVVAIICLLCYYHQRQLLSYVLLEIFTISIGLAIGFICVFINNGKVILWSLISTSVAVVSPTIYTLWANQRGYDLKFLGPFLLGALFVPIIFLLIMIFIPLGKVSAIICGCVALFIICCGCMVYVTDYLIKRCTHDK